MAKITPQRALELLRQLGANVEAAEDDSQEDFNEQDIIKAIDDNRTIVIKPRIQDEIHRDIKGKQGGILRGFLVKTTGISRKILDEIENDEEAIKNALAFREEKYSTDSKTMREELDRISSLNEAEKARIQQEFEAKLAEANNKYISRDINDHIINLLEKKPLPEGADKRRIAEIVRQALAAEVDLGYDENERKVLTYTKGTQNPALNKSKSNAFDWNEALDDVLSPLGLLRKDMRDENPSQHMQKNGVNLAASSMPSKPGSDYMQKVQEALQSMKQ